MPERCVTRPPTTTLFSDTAVLPNRPFRPQDSAMACAAWSDASDDVCTWTAGDELCEMVMDDDDMDSSGSGSGSGEMDNIAESVCTSGGLRDNMTACDANAMCMWETFDTGDDGDNTTMMGGMCSAITCWNQVRVFCWLCCSSVTA